MTEPQNRASFESTGSQWLSADRCNAVVQIAKEAGLAIMRIYARGSQVIEDNTSVKDDNSPLTEADLAAHHVIVVELSVLTPEIPVVSEEDSTSLVHRVADKTFWLIDPLDGTKEFIARNGEFTVNIALVVNGESVWGVVHAPAINHTYWGGLGQGACKQDGSGKPLSLVVGQRSVLSRLGNTEKQGSIRVVASKSHLNEATEAFIESLGVVNLVQAGSSLKFCKVADGGADVYPRLAPTCEWDTAAAQAVVEGAGGHVFDTNGDRLRYGKPELLNPFFIAAAFSYQEMQAIRESRAQSDPLSTDYWDQQVHDG
jgi:3'(2'), 5'-bisphosphate nucleotidase